MVEGHAEASMTGYRIGNLDGIVGITWEIGGYSYSNRTSVGKNDNVKFGIRSRTGVRLRKGDTLATHSKKPQGYTVDETLRMRSNLRITAVLTEY